MTNERVNHDVYLLVAVVLKECVDLLQFGCRDLVQQTGEFILPFLTMSKDGELKRRAVEQYKLDVQDCLLALHVIRHFCVSVWTI